VLKRRERCAEHAIKGPVEQRQRNPEAVVKHSKHTFFVIVKLSQKNWSRRVLNPRPWRASSIELNL